ncbi:four-carbon acid sugar kinase family protein [Terriglobus saanensis]|uniref:Type III effector Hrp-dependent outer protein n=1 Tax=Terriglobus saanensis (strain ATCC BAA-1853 / DSM 23119 / SP1PR4) TaxID=401053 RepID=E8V3I0_TERSS|nr:four-carbon acid sugar kinase family protein [Terriglobus saanensis]ADV83593.1 hypothetical protein AciPR4_2820 [Terriglobus saanensis SP1PR4]
MRKLLQPASVRIIADDLTGACDAAVAFACAGMKTEVEPCWNLFTPSNAEVIAFNTESRDISREASIARVTEAVSRLDLEQGHHIFKKVDSVFRGNTYTEIAAILSSVPHDLAILAPAFPELGRMIIKSQLHHRDLSGEHALPILEDLRKAGVDPKVITHHTEIAVGHKLLLCDSDTQNDLLAVVQTTLGLANTGRVLWIGSGGLAHALAAAFMPSSSEASSISPGGKVVFVVGSDHPVTLSQLQHLKSSEPNAVILPVPRGIPDHLLREQIAPYLSQGISCLFATGGDTALAVCRAMKIQRLQIQSEFARGLPQSRISGGLLDGITFMLKSGGFGDESVLSRIVQTLSTQEMRSAQ